jgi:hypothetical protein
MSQGRKLVLCALLLALVQTGFLGWMIVGRAAVLRDGREVLLKVEPVDPRDLLRGDYVILNYEISAKLARGWTRPEKSPCASAGTTMATGAPGVHGSGIQPLARQAPTKSRSPVRFRR